MTVKLLTDSIKEKIDKEIFAAILRVVADGYPQLIVGMNSETIATQTQALASSLDAITGDVGICIVALLLVGEELPEALNDFPQKICDRINQHSQNQ